MAQPAVFPSSTDRPVRLSVRECAAGSTLDEASPAVLTTETSPAEIWKTLLVWRQHLGRVDLQRFQVAVDEGDSRPRQLIPWQSFWNHTFRRGLASELRTQQLGCRFQPIVVRGSWRVLGHELLVHFDDTRLQFNAADLLSWTADTAERQEIERLCWLGCLRGLTQLPPHSLGFINLNPQLFFHELTSWGVVNRELSRVNIPRQRVVLEILESETPYDPHALEEFVRDCRKQGFGIALDDWGRQAQSLRMLDLVRPDFVKLELELVRGCHLDPYRQTLIKGVIELCRRLNIRIILEGIEAFHDWEWAQNSEADLLQGYFLGRPGREPIASQELPIKNEGAGSLALPYSASP